MRDVVVVGASIGGFSAAAELRARGFDGTIHLIGEEPVRTYERPPLSKGVLAGDDPSSIEWAAARDDDLRLDWLVGETAAGVDVAASEVRLATGETLRYDGLVIATGASPRRLPGQPMVRAVGATIGAVVADVHRREGVDVRLGVGVDAIEGDEHVEAVRTSDGQRIEADLVVVGIGVAPSTAWLEGSGLPVGGTVLAGQFQPRAAGRLLGEPDEAASCSGSD